MITYSSKRSAQELAEGMLDQLEQKTSRNEKIVSALQKVAEAAQLFDELGHPKIAQMLTEQLESSITVNAAGGGWGRYKPPPHEPRLDSRLPPQYVDSLKEAPLGAIVGSKDLIGWAKSTRGNDCAIYRINNVYYKEEYTNKSNTKKRR